MSTYTTVQGDMWDQVAYQQLGSTSYTDQLMWANQKYLGTYIFSAGVELTLPEIDTETAMSLPPWKQS